jgi:hypothetical protein
MLLCLLKHRDQFSFTFYGMYLNLLKFSLEYCILSISRRGLGIFLFTTASRMALGPTHPPIQWYHRLFPWG